MSTSTVSTLQSHADHIDDLGDYLNTWHEIVFNILRHTEEANAFESCNQIQFMLKSLPAKASELNILSAEINSIASEM